MDPAVENWLRTSNLEELIPVFARQKLFSFRRVKGLTESLVREFIPEVGVRIDFIECLSQLKASDSPSPSSETLTGSQSSSTESVRVVNSVTVCHSPNVSVESLTGSHSSSTESTVSVLKIVPFQNYEECSDPDSPPTPTKKRRESSTLISSHATPVKRKRTGSSGPRHILSFCSLQTLKYFDLKDHFLNDVYTKCVLDKYELNGCLSDSDRSAIVQVAAAYMIKNLPVVGSPEYQLMATKICEIFPDEKPEIYFTPASETFKNFSGKLVHRIKNVKSKLCKLGNQESQVVLPSVPVVPNTKDKFTQPAEISGICDFNDPTIVEAINALTHTNFDSWPELLKHWSTTHALRRQNILDSRAPEGENNFLENFDWDVLRASNGYLLLCQDFKELFPSRDGLLLSQRSTVKSKIVTLARMETPKTDLETKQLLATLDSTPDGKQDVLILALLVSLCCKRGRGNTSANLPTPAAARKAFFLHFKSGNDLTRQLQAHLSTLRSQKERFQPTLILVGASLAEISAAYVQVDENTRYLMRTPLAAVDTCLKSFFALDVEYPTDAYPVWLFFQRFFYNIYIEGDKNIARVDSIISSLNGMKRKSSS